VRCLPFPCAPTLDGIRNQQPHSGRVKWYFLDKLAAHKWNIHLSYQAVARISRALPSEASTPSTNLQRPVHGYAPQAAEPLAAALVIVRLTQARHAGIERDSLQPDGLRDSIAIELSAETR
jgi:hypothetical protein